MPFMPRHATRPAHDPTAIMPRAVESGCRYHTQDPIQRNS
ncbi:hypothetical protein SXCC_04527 [Gluconacetobacter sp. SXCC-1]|nr:hypothetical protein SXCC_04527 [Gluconacetobacter sp. SXCC-1]